MGIIGKIWVTWSRQKKTEVRYDKSLLMCYMELQEEGNLNFFLNYFFTSNIVRVNGIGVHQRWLWEVFKKNDNFENRSAIESIVWEGMLSTSWKTFLEQNRWICVLGGLVIADSALHLHTGLHDLSSSNL